MNIELVRLTDRWIGTFGCRVLSAADGIRSLFRSARERPEPRKILIIEISEMGSVILAYSMLKELKKRYPEADVYFLMFEKIRESLDVLGLVPEENVITLSDKNLWAFFVDALRAIRKMRRERIDTVLDMELFARISAIFSFLSGAVNRVGFYRYTMEGLYRGNFLTHKVHYNPYMHIGKNQMALLDALEEDPSESPLIKRDYSYLELTVPKLQNREEDNRRILDKLVQRCPSLSNHSRIVLLNPGGGELPIRAWPLEHYIRLTNRLLEVEDLCVGVMGLAADRRWYERMAEGISSRRFFDFTGMTSDVREVIQLFNCAHVLVTSDSGPAHFAALSSIHTIVFFGPETPVLYGPIGSNYTCLYAGIACSPCLSAYNHRNSPCDGNNVCVKQFTPEYVCGLVLEGLREKGGTQQNGGSS